MPKQSFISIPLDIPDVRVLQTELTKDGELILAIESTLNSTTCRRCGRTITERYGVDEPRLLRHLPILGRVVYLRIRPKRFRCPWCDGHPTTTQQLDRYDPNALHTKAYERHLIVQLVNSTITDVEAKDDVTADALLGILDHWIATSVDWQALEPFAIMGIDEIALLKGHRDFVAVISARSERGDLHVLAVLPDRLKATVVAWLPTIPAAAVCLLFCQLQVEPDLPRLNIAGVSLGSHHRRGGEQPLLRDHWADKPRFSGASTTSLFPLPDAVN